MSPYRQKAAELASRGRYGDSMLVHMNPIEVKAMHEASPMGLTVNPDTGQPEAFLPLLASLAGGYFAPAGYAALGAGLGSFGGSMLSGRDFKDAAISGLLAGGTSGLMEGFGDAALAPTAGMPGYSAAGVKLAPGVLEAEKALRPEFLDAMSFAKHPAPVPGASLPNYAEAYGAKPSFMDGLSATWGEGSPKFSETFGRAVKDPRFYGGAVAAGLGAMGGGLDPLMGVPDTVIPEVEKKARGPNPHLGKNKVFWGKPASWTDADGEWQFYWPQGVTPPGYAHGGIVRAYANGGYVSPGPLQDPRFSHDWGFRTPDPVGLDAPVVDPLGADPLDTTLLPLLPVDDGDDPQVSPARVPTLTPPEEQGYSFAASQRGFEEPTVSVPFSGGQKVVMALGTAAPYGLGALVSGGIKTYNALEEEKKAKKGGFPTDNISIPEAVFSPIGLTVAQQVARNERDRWATEQAGKPELTAWGGWPQADLNSPGGAKAAADVLADHLSRGGGGDYDGSSAPSISTSAPQGAPKGYENAPESFGWAQGGMVRGFQEGGIAAPNDYRRDQGVASAVDERTTNLGGPSADINSVAKAGVHEFMHEGFDAADVKGRFRPVQSLIGGEKRPVELTEELLIRLSELRMGIMDEDDVAYSMPKGSTGEDARMLLRHSTVKGILDELEGRSRDILAAKEVDDFAEFGSYEGLEQPEFKGLSRVTPPRRPTPSDMETLRALESPNAQELIKMSPLAHLGWETNPAIGTMPRGNIVSTYPDGRRASSLAQHFSGGYGNREALEEKIHEWGPPTPAAYARRGIIFAAGGIPRMQADADNIDVAGVPNSNMGNRVRGYAQGDMVAAPHPQQPQQPQQPNPIVMGAVAAIKGQHPEPQKAVMAFVQTYGEPAFAQLRQQVIMAERQGAGLGAGLGGGAVRGPGDGLSDSVPANIDGQEPVALSDGEVVVPADVVSGLGNGSSEAGAKTLEDMNENVRQARTGKRNQPGAIDPMRMLPA